MIEFEDFAFSSLPETGEIRFITGCSHLGLSHKGSPLSKDCTYSIFRENYSGYRVSMVRHPYYWLEKIFFLLRQNPSNLPSNLDPVVKFFRNSTGFEGFLDQFAKNPGIIGNLFDEYRPDTFIRFEDLPWSAISFFISVEVLSEENKNYLVPYLSSAWTDTSIFYSDPSNVLQTLKRKIVDSEISFCERFNYF